MSAERVEKLTPIMTSKPGQRNSEAGWDALGAAGMFPRTFVPVVIGALVLMTVLFYLTAWLSEDAYIDFRVVENIRSGLGPVWNAGERVQAFTSPLWVGALALFSALTASTPPIAALVVSLLCDWIVILVAVVTGIRKPVGLALALVCLFCSQSFLDYSSSGLENPLLQALGVAICLCLWAEPRFGAFKALAAVSLLSGVALCARLDAIVVVGSALILQAVRCDRAAGKRRALTAVVLGIAPFVLWECFSIAYYGSFVPNTALAKLPPGYPRADLIHKGLTLLRATAVEDPGTLFSIVAIPIVLLLVRSRLWPVAWCASGASLAYVIWVGGDFMLGRFLSFVFVFSWLCLLAGVEEGSLFANASGGSQVRRYTITALFVVAGGLSILSLAGQLQRNKFSANYGPQPFFRDQIADERSYYNISAGLRAILAGRTPPWVAEGDQVKMLLAGRKALAAKRNVGMFGYAAGPNVFIVDLLSLGNPFLARLPSCPAARPGHFGRPLPAGYAESLVTGRNAVSDPFLAELMDDVVLATRAPLGASGRMEAIWRLNTGRYDAGRLAAYIKTPGGVRNIGVDPGGESVACPAVANGARTDIIALADGAKLPPWNAAALIH